MKRKLNLLSTLVVMNVLLTLATIGLDEMEHRGKLERLKVWVEPGLPRADESPVCLLDDLRRIYGEKLYSQFDEETLVRYFFKDKQDGYFVDVGAGDYQRNSRTYYLEKNLGWQGIATDVNVAYKDGHAEHRPHSRFFCCYVADRSDPDADQFLRSKLPDNALADRKKATRFIGNAQWVLKMQALRLPNITLSKLLDEEQVKTIDFLSVDFESGAPAALAGFDIKRFQPKLVCVEVDRASKVNPGSTGLIEAYFRTNGYQRVEKFVPLDPANWYFAPAGSGRRVRRAFRQ